MAARPHDITGQRFERLVALEPAHRHAGQLLWRCECDCGATHFAAAFALRSGRVRSCGCLNREKRNARNTKHGSAPRGHQNQVYWVWLAMRRRCRDAKHKDFALYGGRGVTVCQRWDSFQLFVEDMGPRPPGGTIDRINPNGNYEPGNCRWASWSEQRLNQRRMQEAS